MENWAEVMVFMAKKITEAEDLAAYYRDEADRLCAENNSLRAHLETLEVKMHAEDALEAAR